GQAHHLGHMEERLGRDAAPLQADASQRRLLVDDRHLKAQIGRGEGGAVTPRPATDDGDLDRTGACHDLSTSKRASHRKDLPFLKLVILLHLPARMAGRVLRSLPQSPRHRICFRSCRCYTLGWKGVATCRPAQTRISGKANKKRQTRTRRLFPPAKQKHPKQAPANRPFNRATWW